MGQKRSSVLEHRAATSLWSTSKISNKRQLLRSAGSFAKGITDSPLIFHCQTRWLKLIFGWLAFVYWFFCFICDKSAVLRDHSWHGSEYPMGCQGSHPGGLHTRQVPYLLTVLSLLAQTAVIYFLSSGGWKLKIKVLADSNSLADWRHPSIRPCWVLMRSLLCVLASLPLRLPFQGTQVLSDKSLTCRLHCIWDSFTGYKSKASLAD